MHCTLILNIYSLLGNLVPGLNGIEWNTYLVLYMVFERFFIQNNCIRMVRNIVRAADYLSSYPLLHFLNGDNPV